MDHKKCPNCKLLKEITSFSINKTRKDGRNNECKECYHERYLNRSKGSKRYIPFIGTKEEYKKEYSRKHYLENKEYYREKCARRERSITKAAPSWRNTFFILEAYHLAQERTKLTNVSWEVDHIVPIKSKHVCGLHVEHNLQVVPISWNRSKGNKWDYEKGVQTWLS